MIKIWNEAFWKTAPELVTTTSPAPAGGWPQTVPFAFLSPALALGAVSIWLGPFGNTLFEISHEIATQVLEPAIYLRVVLGDLP
jgi:hypothetical protein